MRQRLSWQSVVAFLALVLLLGCSPKAKNDPATTEVTENLRVLANAYLAATQKNNRPPKGPEELKPFLPRGVTDDKVYRSARDGEPFVVIWGADPRKGMDVKPMVIAYEKTGKGGERTVFTAMGVMTMTNDNFTKANFPPGHKP